MAADGARLPGEGAAGHLRHRGQEASGRKCRLHSFADEEVQGGGSNRLWACPPHALPSQTSTEGL